MNDITHAAPADRNAIIALWEQAGLTRPWNDPAADYDRAIIADHAAILKCERGGAIIGTVMVGEDGHRGWVYYLATHPDYEGKGIGRALMIACEQWLKTRGTPKIQFMVRTDNDKALGFYNALGYEAQSVTTLGRFLTDD